MKKLSSYMERKQDHHLGLGDNKYDSKTLSLAELLQSKPQSGDNVIYVHIPFCSKICSFCNMRRFISKPDPSYKDLVIDHIDQVRSTNYGKNLNVDSIYFGGGTPTSMDVEDLVHIVKALKDRFDINPKAEISMETTLSDLDESDLYRLMEAGLNRISIGVQTFDDYGRDLLGRSGDGDFAIEKIQSFKSTGLDNINIDLIYNYPGQNSQMVRQDIKVVKDLDLAGFSLYSLIMGEDSRLAKKVSPEDFKLKKDINHDMGLYLDLVGASEKAGYDFFHLTKMVKDSRDQYKYIKLRHEGKDTLALGAGGGGSILGANMMNPLSLETYKKSLGHILQGQVKVYEEIYYKRRNAVSKVQFGYIDLSLIDDEKRKEAEKLCKKLLKDDLVYLDGDKYKLTSLGKYWGNNISKDLNQIVLN